MMWTLFDLWVLLAVAAVASLKVIVLAVDHIEKIRRKRRHDRIGLSLFEHYEQPVETHHDARSAPSLAQLLPVPVSRSLWRIAEYVMEDFVIYWFKSVSDDQDFLNDIRYMFEGFFAEFARRCIRVDWTAFVVETVVPCINDVLRMFQVAERELLESNADFQKVCCTAAHAYLRAHKHTLATHTCCTATHAYLNA